MKQEEKKNLEVLHLSICPPSESSLKKARPREDAHGDHAKTINGDASAITKDHNQTPGPFIRATKTDFSLRHRRDMGRWGCIDTCCWVIGYICCLWWMLLVLYKALPSLSEAISGPLPDPPGLKLKKEGIQANHPVVFIPGIVTGGLELWEGHPCADGLFRQRLWGGSFGDVYKRLVGLHIVILCFHYNFASSFFSKTGKYKNP